MRQIFAVRHNDVTREYEVYRIATGEAVEHFGYKTESERSRALGIANGWRNDMNALAERNLKSEAK